MQIIKVVNGVPTRTIALTFTNHLWVIFGPKNIFIFIWKIVWERNFLKLPFSKKVVEAEFHPVFHDHLVVIGSKGDVCVIESQSKTIIFREKYSHPLCKLSFKEVDAQDDMFCIRCELAYESEYNLPSYMDIPISIK